MPFSFWGWGEVVLHECGCHFHFGGGGRWCSVSVDASFIGGGGGVLLLSTDIHTQDRLD